LGIHLRFLPLARPRLNPLEGLRRYLKGESLANDPPPDLDAALERACDENSDIDPSERLQTAGVPPGNC
jgi:hypothetical protein